MIRKFSYAAMVITAAMAITSFTLISTDAKNDRETPAPQKMLLLPQPPARWVVDKAHSNVKFTVTHMVVTETEGNFKVFDGSMQASKPDFSDASIQFTVDVRSIDTDNASRDKHLKGDDFFNAAKFPRMKFVSTSFMPAGSNKYTLNGNLTIRDITRPVTFQVTYGGNVQAGFTATTTINRFDYGLTWDKATEAGSLVVSKEVNITVNAVFKKN